MVFYPPPKTLRLPYEPPDNLTLEQFITSDEHRPIPFRLARPPFSDGCGEAGTQPAECLRRIDLLSRSLNHILDWRLDHGSEWNKVMAIFTLNTPDYVTACFAVHRLGGVCTPVNAASSVEELIYQLETSGASALCTCVRLLPRALSAARRACISQNRVFVFDSELSPHVSMVPNAIKSLGKLINLGSALPPLPFQALEHGAGSKKTAFLSYSSGTSGLPKGVMISHRNIIANLLQITTNESRWRQNQRDRSGGPTYSEVILDVLPQSHIYGLVYICLLAFFRGDEVIVRPNFELEEMLEIIQKCRVNTLPLVPPIITNMAKRKELLSKYDLSSVTSIITGAAPLGAETAELLNSQHPAWLIRQGYGMTETATVVSSSMPEDLWFGSSGMLIPGFEARLVSGDGEEVDKLYCPGELLLRSPSIALGYLNNEQATRETFEDTWLRTGDIAEFRMSPGGQEHLWIIDRKKELIKVKGNQVAPAELEAHLQSHEAVADCAVIGIPDEVAGEVPKAFIVKLRTCRTADHLLQEQLREFVQNHKARYKWLKSLVFVDEIPRSAAGKILRRALRDMEKDASQKQARL